MTPDAFRRLGLLACAVALAGGLAAVGYWLAWPVAVAAILVGWLLAFVVTLEARPDEEPAEPALEPEASTAIRTRERSDIERSARRAREIDDDDF